jgi:hypothetical protein
VRALRGGVGPLGAAPARSRGRTRARAARPGPALSGPRLSDPTPSASLLQPRPHLPPPRKRGASAAGYDKAWDKFLNAVYEAVARHVDWGVVKCLVIAGPGFAKDSFRWGAGGGGEVGWGLGTRRQARFARGPFPPLLGPPLRSPLCSHPLRHSNPDPPSIPPPPPLQRTYLDAEAVRRDCRPLIENKARIVVASVRRVGGGGGGEGRQGAGR